MQPKPILVCGSGRTLFSDMQALGIRNDADIAQHFDLMAINDAIMAFPKCQHFASYHCEKIQSWLLLRKAKLRDKIFTVDFMGTVTHGQRDKPGVRKRWTFEDGGGTSSLFGVQVAKRLGYAAIICCGVPMDHSGRFLDPPWRQGHDYKVTDGWDTWLKLHAQGDLDGVYSMSGATHELLGFPPAECYIAGHAQANDAQGSV